MAKNLEVLILGDASSLSRSLAEAEGASSSFGSKMGSVLKTGAIAAAGGIAIAAVAVTKFAEAAIHNQAAVAQLDQALRTTHQSVAAMTPALEDAEAAGRKLGFTDDDSTAALARLELATGSTKEAVKDLGVAQGLARTKNLDLSTATNALAQAMTGSQRAAKQLGIIVSPVTANVDKLKASTEDLTTASGRADVAHAKLLDKMATGQAVIAATTERVKGQAQAFADTAAGGMAQFHAQLEFLEVTLGDALLPTIGAVATALANGIVWLQNSATAHKVVADVVKVLSDVYNSVLLPAFAAVVRVGGDLLDFYKRHTTLVQAVGAAVAGAVIAIEAISLVMAVARTATLAWAAAQEVLDAALTANPIGIVIVALAALGAALVVAYEKSATFRSIVSAALNAVKTVVADVTAFAEAAWQKFGGTLTSVASTALNAVKGYFTNMAAAVSGVFALIGDLVHGRWSKIWGDLGDIVTHAFDALWSLFAGFASIAGELAATVGKAIVDGILSGVSSLASSLADKLKGAVTGAIGGVKSALGIHSPSQVTHDEIGVPLAQGVIEGFLLGISQLPAKVSQSVQTALDAARVTVQNAQGVLSAAFQNLSQYAIQAFEASTTQHLAAMQSKFDAQIQSVVTGPMAKAQAAAQALSDSITANLDALDAKLTPAEAKLKAIQDAHDASGRQQALASAQSTLAGDMAGSSADFQAAADAYNQATDAYAAAQAKGSTADAATLEQLKQAVNNAKANLNAVSNPGVSAQTLQADQQAVQDALYAIQVAGLQKQADAQRTALNAKVQAEKDHQAKILAAQQTGISAAYTQLQAALTVTFNRETLNYQSERDLLEKHLQAMLDALGAKLDTEPGLWQTAHDKIMKLFGSSFGPDYATAGENLGDGFAAGIAASIPAAQAAAQKLAAAVDRFLPHSPAKEGPLSRPPNWKAVLPNFSTGAVKSTMGAAMATVAGGGGSVYNVTVNAPNYLGTKAELAAVVKSALVADAQAGNAAPPWVR